MLRFLNASFNRLQQPTNGEGDGSPLQCSCLENPRDGSLAGCSPWGRTESDTTEATAAAAANTGERQRFGSRSLLHSFLHLLKPHLRHFMNTSQADQGAFSKGALSQANCLTHYFLIKYILIHGDTNVSWQIHYPLRQCLYQKPNLGWPSVPWEKSAIGLETLKTWH